MSKFLRLINIGQEGDKNFLEVNIYGDTKTDIRCKALATIIMSCIRDSHFSREGVMQKFKELVEKAEDAQKVGSKRKRDLSKNDPVAKYMVESEEEEEQMMKGIQLNFKTKQFLLTFHS